MRRRYVLDPPDERPARRAGRTSAQLNSVRLCVVMGSHWSAARGGAQYQAQCIVDEVVKRGSADIYYLAHTVSDNYQPAGYEIVKIGSPRPRGRLGFLPDLLPLQRKLAELRPTVIYQRGLKSYTGICASYAKRHGVRFVFHAAHDDDVRRPSFRASLNLPVRWAERKIAEAGLRSTETIVVQTQDQATLLLEHYGLTASMVVHNFHPLPAEPESRREFGRNSLRVIWVANFKPSKNPEIFVALAEANKGRSDVEFVMIGRPGDEKTYAALHRRIEALGNLRYLGELPIERVNAEIASSDVFVNTSSAEGFANTFIQAWLRGVPVVSCWVDPDQCLSVHGAGVLARDPQGLHSAIEDFRADRARLREFSERALAYGRRHHLPEQAEPLISLLAEP